MEGSRCPPVLTSAIVLVFFEGILTWLYFNWRTDWPFGRSARPPQISISATPPKAPAQVFGLPGPVRRFPLVRASRIQNTRIPHGRAGVQGSRGQTCAASAAEIAHGRSCGADPETTGTWAGGITFPPAGETMTWVEGIWRMPDAGPPAGAENGDQFATSAWVGIDGDDGSPDVLQAGCDVDVSIANGTATRQFLPWWEWYPAGSFWITNMPVSPGDTLNCVVRVDAGSETSASIFLANSTTGIAQTFSVTAPPGSRLSGNCAEWIVEKLDGWSSRAIWHGRFQRLQFGKFRRAYHPRGRGKHNQYGGRIQPSHIAGPRFRPNRTQHRIRAGARARGELELRSTTTAGCSRTSCAGRLARRFLRGRRRRSWSLFRRRRRR